MSFYEARLPVDVERGATGGPKFKTTVIAITSGFEKRNQDWQLTRGSWDVGYGISTKSDLDAVINHFYAMRGMLHGWRFKDWSDFQIGDTFSGDTTTKQSIGVGDATTVDFQVYKRYSISVIYFDRPVTKLVSGTVRVFVNAVEQTETTNYTVDYDTGIITFLSAPGVAADVAVMCEFDIPVRFDTDTLNLTTELFSDEAKLSIPRIPVVEIRV